MEPSGDAFQLNFALFSNYGALSTIELIDWFLLTVYSPRILGSPMKLVASFFFFFFLFYSYCMEA